MSTPQNSFCLVSRKNRASSRPEFPSLWEFPTLPGLHTSAEVAELLSVPTEAVTPLGPATHIFTHIEWQMQGYRVELPPETPLWGGCISIPVAELFASYPIPSAYAAYLKTLR